MATIEGLLAECVKGARAEGFTGDDADYRYTREDLDWVTQELGRKPTAAEWAAAGLASVGSRHVAEGE